MALATLRPSIFVGSGAQQQLLQLLYLVEANPAGFCGVLRLFPAGKLYVQRGKISWVMYPGQQSRLRELLLRHCPEEVELSELLGKARARHPYQTFAQALLATEQVSLSGLRSALISHSLESAARITATPWTLDQILPLERMERDPQLLFSPLELLAGLGAAGERASAEHAEATLASHLPKQSFGIAYLRDQGSSLPQIIATRGQTDLSLDHALGRCRWASQFIDLGSAAQSSMRASALRINAQTSLLAWREGRVHFIVELPSKAELAVALSHHRPPQPQEILP